MKTIKHFAIGLTGIALAIVLTTSARASFVIEQQGTVSIDDSWTVGWLASGGPFDTIVGTVLLGDTFESWATTFLTPVGWTVNTVTANSGSISGTATTEVGFSITFTGSTSDLPPELISFTAYDAGNLVGEETLQWNGTEFEPVPEPTTMIAGALLLLPFGASTLRILRKTRTA